MARHTYATILLFAEGSPEGMKAARDAIRLAAAEDAFLIIASVVDTSTLKQLLSSHIFIEEEMEEYEHELEESCRKQIHYVAQLAEKAAVKHRTSLLRGACHTAILREQKDRSATLLVMGAYRASTARRDLMAREKQLIVDEVPCPVLLVR
ncbi:MAG: universal stress protein [Candidatus Brocadiaceae bacterium]|nr:universal stress protein [Candidatus Brocadiaceae bacterium]